MVLFSFQSVVLLSLLAFAGDKLYVAIRSRDIGRIIVYGIVVVLLFIAWLLNIGIFH